MTGREEAVAVFSDTLALHKHLLLLYLLRPG